MLQEVKFLSAEQILLTTLLIKLAIVATLATMLVRFHQFRRILLTEQRAWPEQAAQRDPAQPHAERIQKTAPTHADGRFKPCAKR